MTDDFVALTLDEYAKRAARTDRRRNDRALSFPLLGLFGEAGGLLSEAKKKQRDEAAYLGYAPSNDFSGLSNNGKSNDRIASKTSTLPASSSSIGRMRSVRWSLPAAMAPVRTALA